MTSCPTLKTQIFRGLIGTGLLVAAFLSYRVNEWLPLIFVALSIIPFKGCPVCWVVYTCEAASNTNKVGAKEESTEAQKDQSAKDP